MCLFSVLLHVQMLEPLFIWLYVNGVPGGSRQQRDSSGATQGSNIICVFLVHPCTRAHANDYRFTWCHRGNVFAKQLQHDLVATVDGCHRKYLFRRAQCRGTAAQPTFKHALNSQDQRPAVDANPLQRVSSATRPASLCFAEGALLLDAGPFVRKHVAPVFTAAARVDWLRLLDRLLHPSI